MVGDGMRTSYAPVNGILVVRRDPLPDKVGEIHLAQQRQARPQTGEILMSDNPDYLAGERIVFAPHSGVLADLEGEIVLLMNPAEVLAVVRT